MRVMTIFGTRPEIIRLSLVMKVLDQHCEHITVHTGQNYDDRLNGLFFRELGVRQPDVVMGVRGSGFAGQVGEILAQSESLFLQHRPDRLLILGDTNSQGNGAGDGTAIGGGNGGQGGHNGGGNGGGRRP